MPWTTPSVSILPTVILCNVQIRALNFQVVCTGIEDWVCHSLLSVCFGCCLLASLTACIVLRWQGAERRREKEENRLPALTGRLDLLPYMYLPHFPINPLFIVCKCSWSLLFIFCLIHFVGRGLTYQLSLITACKYRISYFSYTFMSLSQK